MSSLYGSSILNLDLVLDYNNLINKPTIPQVGYVANGRNFAVALTDNKMFVNVPADAITVATSSDLGGLKIGFSATGNNYPLVLDGSQKAYVVVDKTISPTTDPLPPFTLTADTNINAGADVTFSFEDVEEGSSATTVYSQGITHTNNTGIFTVSTAGQYLISYYLHENDTPGGNARVYGYSCVRREASDGTKIYEYTVGGEYLRNNGTQDDIVISATTSITFNAGERFKIRFYRLYSQNTDNVLIRESLSNLRIERIKYIAT
tara:strand:- start:1145 stop:1933 length:789 start_codon:yes stop_codon:yes gene_type:complete